MEQVTTQIQGKNPDVTRARATCGRGAERLSARISFTIPTFSSGPLPGARLDSPNPILTNAYESSILMHMRTTLILDDELLAKASELSGIDGKTAIVHAGLSALIAQESAKRLAALGGTEKSLRSVPRRRSIGASRTKPS